MQALTNMRKGLSAQQREAPVGGSWFDGIPIEQSNWTELLRCGVKNSQEMQNHNAAASHFNGLGHLSTTADFHNAASNSLNGGIINHAVEAYSQDLLGEGSSWAQLLAMMKAPPAVSQNVDIMQNKIVHTSNKQFIPNLSSPNGINLTSAQANILYMASMNQMAIESDNIDKKLIMMNPDPRKQKSPMQTSFADSLHMSGNDYQASFQQHDGNLTQIYAGGFPRTYQPQYYLNSPLWGEVVTATSVKNSTQFAPATPEKLRGPDNVHYSGKTDLAVSQYLIQNNTQKKSVVLLAENEELELHAEHIVETSSAATGTQFNRKYDSHKGDSQEVYLNKTPPPKTPKRRKHRPKVITEGTPKRGRKALNQKDGDSNTEKRVKRKYVRKKIQRVPSTPEADTVVRETEDKKSELAPRYCRRALNFEVEERIIDESQEQPLYQLEGEITKDPAHMRNTNSRPEHGSMVNNTTTKILPQTDQWNAGIMGNKEAQHSHCLHQAIYQAQTKDRFFPPMHTPTQSPLRDDQTQGRCASTCTITKEATDGSHMENYCGVGAGHQVHVRRDLSLYRKPITEDKYERLLQETSQEMQQRMPHSNQGRGSKRDYCWTDDVEHANSVCSTIISQEFLGNEQRSYKGSLHNRDLETHKKKRVETACYASIPTLHNVMKLTGDYMRQVEADNSRHIIVNQIEKGRSESSVPCYRNSCAKLNQALNYMIGQQHQYIHPEAESHIQGQRKLAEVGQVAELVQDKRANVLASPPNIISPATDRTDSGMQQTSGCSRNKTLIDEQGIEALYKTNKSVCSTKMQEREFTPMPEPERTGSREKQRKEASFDEIICRFQYLNLNSTSHEIVRHEENALVPYKGNGMMVPYEEFDHIRRCKPRPKVDLDPETNRMWKLLMAKETSNDDPEMDANKEKWWEEERKVFRGRADSFIARMHLVQGDRRFSRWKGSVVDSIIGVFLTQNVTDHLSSSAFMSLAARFPVQTTKNSILSQNGVPHIIVEEPECNILEPDTITRRPEKSESSVYRKNPGELSDNRGCSQSFTNNTSTLEETYNWGVEEVISSQDSTGSSTAKVAGKIQSCLASHPRGYPTTLGFDSVNSGSSTSFVLQELENITRCSDLRGHVHGRSSINTVSRNSIGKSTSLGNSMQQQQCNRNNFNSSSSATNHFDINMPHIQIPAQFGSYQIPKTADLKFSELQSTRIFRSVNIKYLSSNASGIGLAHMGATNNSIGQGEPRHYANEGTRSQDNPVAGLPAVSYQNSCRNHQHGGSIISGSRNISDNGQFPQQMQKTQEVPNVNNLVTLACKNENSISVAVKQVSTENKTGESISKEQLSTSSEAVSKANTKTPRTKGEKIKAEKKTAFDWDSLRKQVYSNGRMGDRTEDSMDSIDYEALRHADVSEISKAIKERGMNNMLAERIKDFLDRTIRDHGSIDLEWLKEVPSDKAKDYLLSIWGLGLKSVECVRLLTLHQHAFPVDTNVGRIAVRLGWVPLQPLPESLQLHLLELYPVLESIQKYLWPRLCTLDQRILYELHYQLITFGKVFCTKSKPNCNACPLRGECRHFASAFTSARLALPGPEEKSMVTSAVPVHANMEPVINVKPVQLLHLEDMRPGEVANETRKWEPIIEEPTTPEQETLQVLETDIEDAFYEDPDEIPIIKLTAEDITCLKNYIQENVELQEDDMSKALIALNPEAAYIPVPKLKNVSRLRTEHQVYELPDTHPLVTELDRREPDDPSPYLLAIWTPGETANSILPPEGTCKSLETEKLCSEQTCLSCNRKRESNSQIVRGTILIPCRTAMRGSFPLNGTYFQVNEVFADHDSSLKPIHVSRECIWNLPRRTVYFGTSVSTIFKGMMTEDIQYCFWRGFVCVRGFDRKTRAPRPLMARLHFPASKMAKGKKEIKQQDD